MNTRPLMALLFSSFLGIGLLAVRVFVSGRGHHLYLVGNLVLAWVPLVASIALQRLSAQPSSPRWKLCAAFAVWFLFFPNAPYILTDLVHLGPRHQGVFWIDMLLILLFALTGLVLGFISLRSVQQLIAQRFNWRIGWLFVGGMSILCGIGIYAGRFLRWNSWDVIARPSRLIADAERWFVDPFAQPLSIAFPMVFGVVLFAAYLTIWSLSDEPEQKTQQTALP